ncbi:hypothetical protein LWM68_32610 [Niabella sp. W65]|nr:hypothetical protein [Niabella sp. W65]MCH7367087.1 hypothetical protein [Niabella sp. W65]ULT42764.1 hypothetical protein KRR40_04145 [Niabella sp. I65]
MYGLIKRNDLAKGGSNLLSDEITTKIVTVSGAPLKVVLSEAYRKEFIQRVNLSQEP